jgi:hypothetical protein
MSVPQMVQHGPACPACGTLRDVAGLCGNLLEFAGPLLDHAGHLREFAGHRRTPREGGGGRRATPTITMEPKFILLRDTWHQRSLVIAASNTPLLTLSTCFRRGGGVF